MIIHILAALGLIQGVVLAAALLRARNLNPIGFVALSVALLAAMAIVVETWVVQSGAWRQFPHILRSTTWMPFLIGPGLWLFARSLERPFELRWSALHCLPAGLALTYLLPFYVQSGPDKIAFVDGTHTIPLDSSILGMIKAISLLGYLVATLWALWRLPRSTLTRSAFWAILGFLAYVLLVGVVFASEHMVTSLPVSSDLLSMVGLAGFLYILSILVLANWRGFALGSRAGEASPAPATGKALLDKETADRLYREIEGRVRLDQLYLEPQLTVARLADRTGFQAHYLSYVVNASTGLNVKTWLNTLRVDDARQRLLAAPNDTVLDIALACGFNSKAAFNRAFRTATGQSPTDFRASHFAK